MEPLLEQQHDDGALIEDFRLGNDVAFQMLLEKHTGSVYAFLYRMVQDRVAAEDLVQETFIKVWKHLARFDTAKPFRTWLFAIAKNAAYDWLKKKKSLPFSAFASDGKEEPFADEPDDGLLPDELFFREESAHELDRVLAELPEKHRSLIVLIYQEGFSLHEAAEISGESYNTVKSRHQRAIRQLKSLLAGGLAPKMGEFS